LHQPALIYSDPVGKSSKQEFIPFLTPPFPTSIQVKKCIKHGMKRNKTICSLEFLCATAENGC